MNNENNENKGNDSIVMTPWMGSGFEVSEGAQTAQSVMAEAGLDWTVAERELYFSPDGDVMRQTMVERHKAIVREDNGVLLGVVGHKWMPLQNHEAFDFVDQLIEMGALHYHSAGSFKEGKIIWIQAEFAESEIVPGDVHKKYLLLVSAFDGTIAVRIGETDIRVVCQNTLMAALMDFRDRDSVLPEVRIKHTQSMKEKIEAAKTAIAIAQNRAQEGDNFMRALARMPMTSDMWSEFGHVLIPDPEGRRNTRAKNNRDKLISLGLTGVGQDIPGVAGTGYAAFNAATEYVNFHRSSRGKDIATKQANRFRSVLFGQSNKFIGEAVNILNGFLVDNSIQVDSVV